MPLVHLNGTDLFYVEVGEGLPCLVMHGGLGLDHTSMHPWLDPLQRIAMTLTQMRATGTRLAATVP
jgi:hypothetical protein